MKKTLLLIIILISNIVLAQKSYSAKNGITYKVGDSITLGKPTGENNSYKFIMMKPNVFGSASISGYGNTNLPGNLEGRKLLIKGIKVYQGQYAMIDVELLKNTGKWMIVLDQAIDSGEIYDANRRPSREQAIKILEDKKKLLDLNVISKEDYEKEVEKYKEIIID